MVFVRAEDLRLTGTETPPEIDGDRELAARLEADPRRGRQAYGIPGSAAVPKIAMVAPPFRSRRSTALTTRRRGGHRRACDLDGTCHRRLSADHGDVPGGGVAIDGNVVSECAGDAAGDLRLGHPSGRAADRRRREAARRSAVGRARYRHRTARRLMEGFVRIP